MAFSIMARNLRSVAALSHRFGSSVVSRQAARKYYTSSPLPEPFGAGFPFGAGSIGRPSLPRHQRIAFGGDRRCLATSSHTKCFRGKCRKISQLKGRVKNLEREFEVIFGSLGFTFFIKKGIEHIIFTSLRFTGSFFRIQTVYVSVASKGYLKRGMISNLLFGKRLARKRLGFDGSCRFLAQIVSPVCFYLLSAAFGLYGCKFLVDNGAGERLNSFFGAFDNEMQIVKLRTELALLKKLRGEVKILQAELLLAQQLSADLDTLRIEVELLKKEPKKSSSWWWVK